MDDLPHILNWRRVNKRITLSGQPTEAQLAELKAQGVLHVINLGPHHNKGALADEAGTLAALGMTYVYIPVEFEEPTDASYDQFCTAMAELAQVKVHVHCIYNARVSAFFYRYAKAGNEMSEADAFELIDGIWRPGDDWARFVDRQDAVDQPNRYAEDDY